MYSTTFLAMFGVWWALPTSHHYLQQPKILLQSSTRLHYLLHPLCQLPPIFLHIYLPIYLVSYSPSELPPGHPCPHQHYPQKLHLRSKLSHHTVHLQSSMNTLKIILVPVRNCSVFTSLGLKMVQKTEVWFLLQSVWLFSKISVSNLSWEPKWLGTKAAHWILKIYLYSTSQMFFSSAVAPWVSVEASWSWVSEVILFPPQTPAQDVMQLIRALSSSNSLSHFLNARLSPPRVCL